MHRVGQRQQASKSGARVRSPIEADVTAGRASVTAGADRAATGGGEETGSPGRMDVVGSTYTSIWHA
jgi:hypothetical protein